MDGMAIGERIMRYRQEFKKAGFTPECPDTRLRSVGRCRDCPKYAFVFLYPPVFYALKSNNPKTFDADWPACASMATPEFCNIRFRTIFALSMA